ncbi:hypothetical protein DMENIID0001_081160 [Sergentomyia squamirostris]
MSRCLVSVLGARAHDTALPQCVNTTLSSHLEFSSMKLRNFHATEGTNMVKSSKGVDYHAAGAIVDALLVQQHIY